MGDPLPTPSRADAGLPPGASRLRTRAVAVAAAVAVLAASAVLLEREAGPRAAHRPRGRLGPSGSWYCPHGGSEGWRAWVVLTNPGSAPVSVRITALGRSGTSPVADFAVGPGRQVYREVPAADPGASARVEYFGGWVGVGSVVRAPGREGGMAAESCAAAPRRSWFLPDEPTGRGRTAHVVVMNPFTVPAEFRVVIRTEKRTIEPGPLSPYVLDPGTSVGLRLNQYALQGPGERTVAVQVVEQSGRVVAGGVGVSPGGLRAEVGSHAPSERVVLPAAGYAGPPRVALVNPSGHRSDLVVVAQNPTGQQPVTEVGGESVAPGGVRTLAVAVARGGGVVVESTNRRPVAAMLRLAGRGGDLATLGPAEPGRAWLVLPSLPPEGGEGLLALQNPGPDAAHLSFQVFGEDGPVPGALPSRVVPAGRTVTVDLSPVAGGRPVSVLVVAERGTVVVGGASYPGSGSGYAATTGVSVPREAAGRPG